MVAAEPVQDDKARPLLAGLHVAGDMDDAGEFQSSGGLERDRFFIAQAPGQVSRSW